MKIFNFLLISFTLLFILTGCGENEHNIQENSSILKDETFSNSSMQNIQVDENNVSSQNIISTFSTVIKDTSPGRLTNISLTCNTLNGTIVKPDEVFSFNDVIGEPTAEKGYQEASIIIDHHTTTGIGGGNCQVSSTLYNAVLNTNSLVVVERHEHGKDVGYVPEGKDATISYGSLDFKFRNDTGHKIKIEAVSDNQNITINIVQLVEQYWHD